MITRTYEQHLYGEGFCARVIYLPLCVKDLWHIVCEYMLLHGKLARSSERSVRGPFQ